MKTRAGGLLTYWRWLRQVSPLVQYLQFPVAISRSSPHIHKARSFQQVHHGQPHIQTPQFPASARLRISRHSGGNARRMRARRGRRRPATSGLPHRRREQRRREIRWRGRWRRWFSIAGRASKKAGTRVPASCSEKRLSDQAAWVTATPLLFSSSCNSPVWNISRTMSQPPTNSPFT
jgi:hypothetical protein